MTGQEARVPQASRPEGSTPFISIRNLTKTYETVQGDPVVALQDISLDIEDGEFIAIVGPSGCGKSTFLKILAGLIAPTQAVIYHNGRPGLDLGGRVGFVFQSPVLLPWRTVLSNCLLPIELRRTPDAADRERAMALLESVGLQGFEKRYPAELSGGMQQRVSLCRALMHDPAVLLLDEPFGALDALTRDRLNAELHRLWLATGKTTVLVTHSISEAVYLAQRVIVMSPRPGRIVEEVMVPLPRERHLDIMSTSEFNQTAMRIRRHFTDHA